MRSATEGGKVETTKDDASEPISVSCVTKINYSSTVAVNYLFLVCRSFNVSTDTRNMIKTEDKRVLPVCVDIERSVHRAYYDRVKANYFTGNLIWQLVVFTYSKISSLFL